MGFNTFQTYCIRVFFNKILILTHYCLETTIRFYLVVMDGIRNSQGVGQGKCWQDHPPHKVGSLSLAVVFNATLPNWISIELAQLREQQDVQIIQPHTIIVQS